MIRWSYIVPRLAIVLVILALLRFATGPAAGWGARFAYENATGGRLDIEHTEVNLFPPRLSFHGVQLGDPRHERENVAEFDRIEIALDGDSLLHRRWVVSHAKLTGIRFSSERPDSGRIEQLPTAPVSNDPSYLDHAVDGIGDWLERSTKEQSNAAIESLQTVHLARALEDQWKTRYTQERARAERIETSVRSIRDNVRAVDNPLRDLPRIQQAIAEAQRLQQDLIAARRLIAETPQQLQSDMQRMQEAKAHDVQQVTKFLPIDGPLKNVGQLTDALLQKYYKEPLNRMREYAMLGRNAANLTVSRPKATREEGIDFDLDQRSKDPFFFAKRCELSGHVSIDEQSYVLTGLVDDLALADDPQPVRVRLKLEGVQEIRMDYQRDPKAALSHHLAIHIPRLAIPETSIKAGSQLTLRSAPVPMQFWADISTDGEQLQGRLLAKQPGAVITATLNGSEPVVQLVQNAVNQSLSELHELDFDANLSGTWDRPQINVHSSLEGALAQAFKSATSQLTVFAERQIREEVDRTCQKQIAQFEALVGKQQVELEKLLAQVESEVQEVTSKVAGQLNRTPFQLGQLPGLPKL